MTKAELIAKLIRLEPDRTRDQDFLRGEPYAYVALVLRAASQRARGIIQPGEWPRGRKDDAALPR